MLLAIVTLIFLVALLIFMILYYVRRDLFQNILCTLASKIDPEGDKPQFDELPKLPDTNLLKKQTVYIRPRGQSRRPSASPSPYSSRIRNATPMSAVLQRNSYQHNQSQPNNGPFYSSARRPHSHIDESDYSEEEESSRRCNVY